MTHNIKLNIGFCDAVYHGLKTFEIRKNDRGYQTGDHIVFQPVTKRGTEQVPIYHPISDEEYEITYILSGWGIENGYIVFAFQPVEYEDQ